MFEGNYYTASTGRTFAGFGLDVVYQTAADKAKGIAEAQSATTGVNCTDAGPGHGGYALQQMLTDLGYPLTVDGQVGTNTLKAVKAFAVANGIPYNSAGLPQGAICQAIMTAWQAIKPPTPEQSVAPVAKQPFMNKAILAAMAPAPRSAALPAQMAPVPGSGPLASVSNWWSSQSTYVQVGIGVGGAVALLLVAKLVMGKPKAAPAAMTPNKRGKRKTTRMLRNQLHR